jgi:hypothetical protein
MLTHQLTVAVKGHNLMSGDAQISRTFLPSSALSGTFIGSAPCSQTPFGFDITSHIHKKHTHTTFRLSRPYIDVSPPNSDFTEMLKGSSKFTCTDKIQHVAIYSEYNITLLHRPRKRHESKPLWWGNCRLSERERDHCHTVGHLHLYFVLPSAQEPVARTAHWLDHGMDGSGFDTPKRRDKRRRPPSFLFNAHRRLFPEG